MHGDGQPTWKILQEPGAADTTSLGAPQQEAHLAVGPYSGPSICQVKAELVKPTILTLYDPEAATKISADASSHGLAAVLLQRSESTWKPIAYASHSMTATECRYVQIEKEALATTWACDKFATYIPGKKETAHKPLVPLVGTKHLDNLPLRVLRFRFRPARYDYSILHVPGKLLYTAVTLSRAPTSPTDCKITNTKMEEAAEMLMEVSIAHLPASQQRISLCSSYQPNLFHSCELLLTRVAGQTQH